MGFAAVYVFAHACRWSQVCKPCMGLCAPWKLLIKFSTYLWLVCYGTTCLTWMSSSCNTCRTPGLFYSESYAWTVLGRDLEQSYIIKTMKNPLWRLCLRYCSASLLCQAVALSKLSRESQGTVRVTLALHLHRGSNRCHIYGIVLSAFAPNSSRKLIHPLHMPWLEHVNCIAAHVSSFAAQRNWSICQLYSMKRR